MKHLGVFVWLLMAELAIGGLNHGSLARLQWQLPKQQDSFASLITAASSVSGKRDEWQSRGVPDPATLDPKRRDALGLLGLASPHSHPSAMDPVTAGARVGRAPTDTSAAVSTDQRTVLALLETVETVRSMTSVKAGQYFELIEDPLLNLAVPVIISIVISIIKMPIIMLLIEIINFFLMKLLAVPLALMLYAGVDPESVPGADAVPGMKPSSPLAMAVQESSSSSSSTTTTTTTVVEEEYEEEFLQLSASPLTDHGSSLPAHAWRIRQLAADASTSSGNVLSAAHRLSTQDRLHLQALGPSFSEEQVALVAGVLQEADSFGLDRAALLQTAADHISAMRAAEPALPQRASFRTPGAPRGVARRALGLLRDALNRLRQRRPAAASIRQRLGSLLQVAQRVTSGSGVVPQHDHAAGTVGLSDERRSQALQAARRVLEMTRRTHGGWSEMDLHPAGLAVAAARNTQQSLLQRAGVGAADAAAAAAGAVARSGARFGGCEARRDFGSCTTSPLSDGTICSWCTSEGAPPHHADVWKAGSTTVGRCVSCRTAWDQQMPDTHGPDKAFWGHSSLQLSKLGWTCNPTPQSCDATDATAKAEIAAKARAKDAQDDTQLYAMGLTDDDFPVGGTPKPPDAPANEMSEVASEAASDALAAVVVPPFHATTHSLLAGGLHTSIAREVSSRAVQSLALDLGETLVSLDVVPRVQRGIIAGLSATLTRSLAADVAGAVVPTLALSLTRDPTEDHYCLLCEKQQLYCANCRASEHRATNTFNSGWLYGRYFGRQFGLDAMQTVEQTAMEEVASLRRVAELGNE